MKTLNNTKTTLVILLITLVVTIATQVYSHCQIPCGIYDDATRLKLISEHTLTIEKSM